MTSRDLARLRMVSQGLASPGATLADPAAVVNHFGGMQAQDYLQALWAIGVRLPSGTTEAQVEQAIADRQIVRTWPMRGTLHFVNPADVRWMLQLLTPRIIAGSALRQRQLELDATIFVRCEKIFLKALRGGHQLTREALLQLLEQSKISTTSQRGYHILWRLSQEGLLCIGPRQGKSQTFVLLDEWIPNPTSTSLTGTEALVELASRFFTSRGPATLADFAGWAGVKLSDARTGLEGASSSLEKLTVNSTDYWLRRDLPSTKPKSPAVHLLPGFDEILLGYKDRSASLDPAQASKIVPGNNGIFLPTMVADGQVIGTWKRVLKKKNVEITLLPFAPLTKSKHTAFTSATTPYRTFLDLTK
ncbi:MAG TPA: winged helix DNA-binding domain-containing protein [Verrucomicrobium sp.]|nr:winged helix DNA-binding domain-containing protein [Verrucomicrobium sp.]